MKAVILAVGLFLPLSFYSVVSAQLTKMTVGYSAITGAHLPAWLAKETSIFAKNGLDVQLVYVRGHRGDGPAIKGDSNKSGGWFVDRECQSPGGRCGDDCWGNRYRGPMAHESARD
jgi:hypothetical protein